MPIIPGSPLLMNSYRPGGAISGGYRWMGEGRKHTRHLVGSQSECISDHLLVHICFELKDDSADGNARSPMIEAALASPHSAFVALGIDGGSSMQSSEQSEVHAS